MTQDQAVQIVQAKRRKLQIDPEMAFESARKAVVEYKKNPDTPGPTEDRIAWIVTFSWEWGYVNVHVDERTGDILAVRRSS